LAKTVQNRFAGYKTHFMNQTLRYWTSWLSGAYVADL